MLSQKFVGVNLLVKNRICFPRLEMAPYSRPAFVRGDVALEGNDLWDRFDRGEVDTDDEGVLRHCFGSDLTPGARSGTQVQEDFALLEKAIFFVQLDQLEAAQFVSVDDATILWRTCLRCSSSVSLFFGKLIPLVKPALAVLLLNGHGFSVVE